MSFQNEDEMETFSGKKKKKSWEYSLSAKLIRKNGNDSSLDRNKMIKKNKNASGKFNLYTWVKISGNGKYMSKQKRLFIILLNVFKL